MLHFPFPELIRGIKQYLTQLRYELLSLFAKLTGQATPTHLATLPFLCVITPIFDDALPSVTRLVAALQAQSKADFIHVLISNGPSPQIERYLKTVTKSTNDQRFIYVERDYEPTPTRTTLLSNVGKRRDLAMKRFNAQRYWFLDADFKLTNSSIISKLAAAHRRWQKPILMIPTKKNGVVLPQHPFQVGRLDISNYTFSYPLAKWYTYPWDVNYNWQQLGFINDYRFFELIYRPSRTHELRNIAGVINGNQSYTPLSNDPTPT